MLALVGDLRGPSPNPKPPFIRLPLPRYDNGIAIPLSMVRGWVSNILMVVGRGCVSTGNAIPRGGPDPIVSVPNVMYFSWIFW
jgi:hypothetical protein